MRKFIALSLTMVALTVFAKIILYTDKPNSVPVDSDFFSLQRNQDYISASVAQVRGSWFTSPSFTGNATFGGNLTVTGPFQYFGDGSQLSGIPSSSVINSASNTLYQLFSQTTNGMFILANNGNGTNTTNWGVSSFDEVDVASMIVTNFFTGKTNAPLLSTDGNGEFVATDFTAATNNDTKISSDGTNNVLAFSNNITAGISAALVSPTNSFSGNGSGLTNLTYQYKTNAVSNGALTFGEAYRTNINADITLASYTLGPNGASMYESLVILATNSDTAVHKITHPSGVFTGGAAAVSWITNGYWNEVVVDHFATLYTNAQVKN